MELNSQKNIYLTGFMTSGKSTWGKQLAKRLNRKFVDLDALIEAEQGRSIAEIFAKEGEEAFRTMESTALKKLNDNQNLVVATGGGTPCLDANLEVMKIGLMVYLQLPVNILIGRLKQDRLERPLVKHLDDDELSGFVNRLLSEREPFYKQASLVIEASSLTIGKLERAVLDQLT